MYPLSTRKDFAVNHWYVAGWSSEISRTPLSRHILGTPVMFYRTEADDVIAMLDMCPHRRFPLSKGKLVGDQVQCQYHGITFASDGACVRIPAQKNIPTGYRVRTFPVVEKWEWIWIWMGEPELADPTTIPDHTMLCVDEKGWLPTVGGLGRVEARHVLVHENLLDLSHLSFLHENTIGSDNVAATKMNFSQKNDVLEISRYIRSAPADSFPHTRLLKLTDLVDRAMIQRFFPPCLHVVGSDFTSAEEGGKSAGRKYAGTRVIHAITPETAHTTHYFWAFSRNFLCDDEHITATLHRLTLAALEEDFAALKAIEANLTSASNPADDIHCQADGAALRGRRVMERLIDAENDSNLDTR